MRDVVIAVDGEPVARRPGARGRARAPARSTSRRARRPPSRRRDARHVYVAARAPEPLGPRLDLPPAVFHRPRLPPPRRDHLSLQADARSGAGVRALPRRRGVLPVDVRRPHHLSLHARLAARIRCSARSRCICSRSFPRCARAGRAAACSCRSTPSAARSWRGGSVASTIRAMSDIASLTSAAMLLGRVRHRSRPPALHHDARLVAGGAQPRQVDLRRPRAHLHDGGRVAVRLARGRPRRAF